MDPSTQALPSAHALRTMLPLDERLAAQIRQQRHQVREIIHGNDPRLLVIVGPCSLHHGQAALEYGGRLADLADELRDDLLIVMRAYVEKPRTTVGWKGLMYDPDLNGSDDMSAGLERSRSLMLELAGLGLPLACEMLQPMAAQYFSDLLSWVAIGARTCESQIHRELVSSLDVPAGFKNGTDGGLGIACDAICSAAHPHRYFGIDLLGRPALIRSTGNPDCHLVLRGGRNGPNHHAEAVDQARVQLTAAGIAPRLLVDCSHANSGKDYTRQPQVLEEVLAQRRAGNRDLFGIMLESNLNPGRQDLSTQLRYGVSITDGCLGWDDTRALLRRAAELA
ncbi:MULTISPECIES: 3-deoxy-7-phosphoheptulonate synthase [unclassified Pseudomonas]|uniref:3-deoxy-7-phosphoheptulonate synthase n=1 Tax=unclassified Pseudomonas TaxID=196821 RepID=UPI002449B01F|nr:MULTISPECIES: 3-deoxy-7-phosphoheptulonate synthase [unclassified Pseudomonas]MDH0304200.1 3-deoxy-7-phosphoheptulonate synthase [Pseudomonas sp. GD04091]MDH1986197.1 3-deoxy-7-phosphoheptulonate synthase [Pseudomonas sp. GD03689]